ncbi:hypothetical protein D3C76_1524930 [compost metagenome]
MYSDKRPILTIDLDPAQTGYEHIGLAAAFDTELMPCPFRHVRCILPAWRGEQFSGVVTIQIICTLQLRPVNIDCIACITSERLTITFNEIKTSHSTKEQRLTGIQLVHSRFKRLVRHDGCQILA